MAVGMALRLLLTGHIEALSSCRENPVGHKLMFSSNDDGCPAASCERLAPRGLEASTTPRRFNCNPPRTIVKSHRNYARVVWGVSTELRTPSIRTDRKEPNMNSNDPAVATSIGRSHLLTLCLVLLLALSGCVTNPSVARFGEEPERHYYPD